jgi:hypothetical protein
MAINIFADYGNELRDDQIGIAVQYHTQGQRDAYLRRHPELAGQLPAVGRMRLKTRRDMRCS